MKRSPLKRVSAKRAQQLRKYASARKKFLNFLSCGICSSTFATEIHHMAGRIGEKLLDERDWLAVCRRCHRKIHDEPAWARERGYLR